MTTVFGCEQFTEAERLFRRLKGFRRFDKPDPMFIAFIYFAPVAEALRQYRQRAPAGKREDQNLRGSRMGRMSAVCRMFDDREMAVQYA